MLIADELVGITIEFTLASCRCDRYAVDDADDGDTASKFIEL